MMRLLQRSFVATPWVLSSSSVDNAFLLSFFVFSATPLSLNKRRPWNTSHPILCPLIQVLSLQLCCTEPKTKCFWNSDWQRPKNTNKSWGKRPETNCLALRALLQIGKTIAANKWIWKKHIYRALRITCTQGFYQGICKWDQSLPPRSRLDYNLLCFSLFVLPLILTLLFLFAPSWQLAGGQLRSEFAAIQ